MRFTDSSTRVFNRVILFNKRRPPIECWCDRKSKTIASSVVCRLFSYWLLTSLSLRYTLHLTAILYMVSYRYRKSKLLLALEDEHESKRSDFVGEVIFLKTIPNSRY